MKGLSGFKRSSTNHGKPQPIRSTTTTTTNSSTTTSTTTSPLSLNLNLSGISNFNLLNSKSHHQHQYDPSQYPVRYWGDREVSNWLMESGLNKYDSLFRAHDINGQVLLELTHSLLKMMPVTTIGDRIKILESIKELKRTQDQDPRSLLPSKPTSTPFWSTKSTPSPNKISPLGSLSSFGSLLKRSKTIMDSPISSELNNNNKWLPETTVDSKFRFPSPLGGMTPPSSPDTPLETSKFDLGSLLSFGLINQNQVRIFGNDGQSKLIQFNDERNPSTVLKRILTKFNITEDPTKYAIFIVSGDSARSLTDDELLDLHRRSDKSKLVLRKLHHPTHPDDLTTTTPSSPPSRHRTTPRHIAAKSSPLLETHSYSNLDTTSSPKQSKLTRIFGARPPSMLISSSKSDLNEFNSEMVTIRLDSSPPPPSPTTEDSNEDSSTTESVPLLLLLDDDPTSSSPLTTSPPLTVPNLDKEEEGEEIDLNASSDSLFSLSSPLGFHFHYSSSSPPPLSSSTDPMKLPPFTINVPTSPSSTLTNL